MKPLKTPPAPNDILGLVEVHLLTYHLSKQMLASLINTCVVAGRIIEQNNKVLQHINVVVYS